MIRVTGGKDCMEKRLMVCVHLEAAAAGDGPPPPISGLIAEPKQALVQRYCLHL